MSSETTVKKEYQALLTPWKIGNCEIKNRFVVTSMGGTDLFGWMERNHFDKEGAKFILEAAKGGAGLSTTSANRRAAAVRRGSLSPPCGTPERSLYSFSPSPLP